MGVGQSGILRAICSLEMLILEFFFGKFLSRKLMNYANFESLEREQQNKPKENGSP